MPYMMSDLAAGSSAVEQLQRNVAEAPYVKDLTQAAAERKIQEDRLAKQYAPEMMAAKAEEEQMRLQTARLQKLATNIQYTRDKESTAQLQQWLQTDEGKKASDLDVTKKAASLKMHAGLTEEGAKLYERAEKMQATELSNQQKQLAQDYETLSTASVVLNSQPDEKVEEFFNRLPKEQKDLLLKNVGEENWSKATGAEKKEIANRLFLNTKGQLMQRKMENDKARTEYMADSRETVAQIKADSAEAIKKMAVDSAEKIVGEKIASAEKIASEKLEAKIKEIEAKHKGEMEKLKETFVGKKELENLQAKHKKEIENLRESGKTTRAAAKTDVKDASFYMKEHDKIVKAGQEEEKSLEAKVTAAKSLLSQSQKADWFSPVAKLKEDTRQKNYDAAVNSLDDFRKRQTQKELDAFKNAPDFPKKSQIIRELENRLAATSAPQETPPAKAEAPKAAPAPAPAKDVPSNKPLSESEFNKQWPTLKKGQSLIGPDGKTYTKGG
jgi:hypothetical protein